MAGMGLLNQEAGACLGEAEETPSLKVSRNKTFCWLWHSQGMGTTLLFPSSEKSECECQWRKGTLFYQPVHCTRQVNYLVIPTKVHSEVIEPRLREGTWNSLGTHQEARGRWRKKNLQFLLTQVKNNNQPPHSVSISSPIDREIEEIYEMWVSIGQVYPKHSDRPAFEERVFMMHKPL